MTPRVVLVGAPGSGKTTVGGLLARRLGVELRDTDADVVQATGRPISEIFVDDGEAAFRVLEARAVAAALREHDGVLSLGGGAVLDADTRQLLRDCPVVVHLEVGMAAAATRVGLARDRPVLAINPRAQLHQLLAERAPLYQEVSTVTVPTDGRKPAEVVDDLCAAIGAS